MRKESPLVFVFDGDRLVSLFINCPTATYPAPSIVELELVRIFNEHKNQQTKLEEIRRFAEIWARSVMRVEQICGERILTILNNEENENVDKKTVD